jgi:hypothetical protein
MKLITLILHNFNQINRPVRGGRMFDQNWEVFHGEGINDSASGKEKNTQHLML